MWRPSAFTVFCSCSFATVLPCLQSRVHVLLDDGRAEKLRSKCAICNSCEHSTPPPPPPPPPHTHTQTHTNAECRFKLAPHCRCHVMSQPCACRAFMSCAMMALQKSCGPIAVSAMATNTVRARPAHRVSLEACFTLQFSCNFATAACTAAVASVIVVATKADARTVYECMRWLYWQKNAG